MTSASDATERGLAAAIVGAYPDPRASMARQFRSGLSEARALFYLMAACGLLFVASMPNAIRAAGGIVADEPVTAAIGAHLFGYLFMAPLMLYALAAAVHAVALGFGATGSWADARAALFWALLLAGPIALAIALAGAAAEIAFGASVLPWLAFLRYAGFAFWLWIFAACLAEAEGFRHSGRVAVVVVAAFGLVAGIFAALAGGGGV